MTPGGLRVVATGPLATVQDLGRPGWFAIGVGVSGAADRPSLRLANRLVGNPEGAAAVECLLGGLELEALTPVTVAVTGAEVQPRVDGVPVGHGSVVPLRTGQRLSLGLADAGLRAYIAVRGGVDVPPVLGSRSRDTLAGIGPEPLTVGRHLPVGIATTGWPVVDVAPVPALTTEPVHARVVLGPRDDWFVDAASLFTGHWVMTDRLDRVGARLSRPDAYPALTRRRDGELPTEGMPVGAVQVPPSGEPVVFLADHPITGGYPVVGVVVTDDIPLLAQARPAQRVTFRPAG